MKFFFCNKRKIVVKPTIPRFSFLNSIIIIIIIIIIIVIIIIIIIIIIIEKIADAKLPGRRSGRSLLPENSIFVEFVEVCPHFWKKLRPWVECTYSSVFYFTS